MRRGLYYALAAAFFFGLSTPFSKELLEGGLNPFLLAGLLYLGSGLGPGLWLLFRGNQNRGAEISLTRSDWRWLLPGTLCGGIVAPVLLTHGLSHTPASESALLLNLECAFTAALAWLVFGETFQKRALLGIVLILVGSGVLSFQPGALSVSWGCLLIAGSCLFWGLDNNFTRRIAAVDSVQITAFKGLAAGSVNVALALALGAKLPGTVQIAEALLLGCISYGLCLICMVRAFHVLGAARTSAWFSAAPFFGALLSFVLLGERPDLRFGCAAGLMALGLALYPREIDKASTPPVQSLP